MKEWWVYELCAGRWRYIGMTSNPKGRLASHRYRIRKGGMNEQWAAPLEEHPNPESWDMRIIEGPFDSKSEAIAAEHRYQEEQWTDGGRLWLKCGDANSESAKNKIRESVKQNPTRHWLGKKMPDTSKMKKPKSDAHKQALKEAWVRRRAKKAASQ